MKFNDVRNLKKSILIIDDDLDLLMLLERKLQMEGYEVETAASLPEGEILFARYKPDVVLLDINLHGEDGRQLCWKIKKHQNKPAKVIVMSGYECDTGLAILFGADDFLQKPLNTEFLLYKLNDIFRHNQIMVTLNDSKFEAA